MLSHARHFNAARHIAAARHFGVVVVVVEEAVRRRGLRREVRVEPVLTCVFVDRLIREILK